MKKNLIIFFVILPFTNARFCYKDDEEYVLCMPTCAQSCENKHKICDGFPFSCTPGCRCKLGFVRSSTGSCIVSDDYCCPENEYYSFCGSACQTTCDTLHKPCVNQTENVCHNGCYCNNGYARNSNGICVPSHNCPPPPIVCTEPNTELYQCIPNCPQTCENLNRICTNQTTCIKGCACKSGFVRDVMTKECVDSFLVCPTSTLCTENAVQLCGTCNATCDTGSFSVKCRKNCTTSCYCIDGYIMNSDGICEPSSTCLNLPTCTGQNTKYYTCKPNCPQTCAFFNNCTVKTNCIPGCACNEGYVIDSNTNNCVNGSVFCAKPVTCSHVLEIYKYDFCDATCDDLNFVCNQNILASGTYGCYCRDGFVRNSNGTCIPSIYCPDKCTEANQEFTNCLPCEQTCENLKNNCTTTECVPGCACKPGFIYDPVVGCVSSSEGCKNVTCPINQIYKCSTCRTTCDTIGRSCTSEPTNCTFGCFCVDGYVLNDNSKCIAEIECPNINCRNNEIYNCQDHDNYCPVINQPNATSSCVYKCYCDIGFVRDINGACIEPEFCTNPCQLNEYWDCKTCDNYCNKATCRNPPTDCMYDCYCNASYVRNNVGQCVEPISCDANAAVCSPFAEYSCAVCDTYCNSTRCIPSSKCQLGCYCETGYSRNSLDQCYNSSLCSGLCLDDPHKVYMDCGPKYPQTCACADNSCPLNVICDPGCHCIDNYTLDPSTSRCTLTTELCINCTHINEVLDCRPCDLTCDTTNELCPSGSPKCHYGCFCQNGSVRNYSNNMCIEKLNCPNLNCAMNEYWDCKTCDNYCNNATCRNPPTDCVYDCYCNASYVRNNVGQCVNPISCDANAAVCPPFEEYSCAVCDTYCNSTRCAPSSKCQLGCYCETGYSRNSLDQCYNSSLCTGTCLDNPYQVYMDCGPKNPQTCDCVNKNNCLVEITTCNPGCFCIDKYVFDPETRLCALATEFCKSCSGVNEVWTCELCDLTCDTSMSCPSGPTACQYDCFCELGYARYSNNTCIPELECPNSKCESYEKWDCLTCDNYCNNASCRNQPTSCTEDCYCDLNHKRNDEGDCVEEALCLSVLCDINEEYACATSDNYCNSSRSIQTSKCKLGCYCKNNFSRNGLDQCIDTTMCIVNCTDLNSAYYDCGPECPQTCEFISNTCTEPLTTCRPGCYCDVGYIFDPLSSKCVSADIACANVTCNSTEYYACNTCDRLCSTPGEPCIVTYNNCSCFCKDGYVRDSNNVCTEEENCSIGCYINETYTSNSICEPTCIEKVPDLTNCNNTTVVGCFCKPGFLRSPYGDCISENDCFTSCSLPNEELLPCSNCPQTCEYLTSTCTPSTLPCSNRCSCKIGFVRDTINRCVDSTTYCIECPSPNEHFYCGTCEATCDNLNSPCNISQTKCTNGCYCDIGFVRTSTSCVSDTTCKSTICADPNASYMTDGPKCPQTCEFVNATCTATDPVVSGCYCNSGYVFDNSMNLCVDSTLYCSNSVNCSSNEYYTCGTCESTCETIGQACNISLNDCTPDCFCKSGYAREKYTNDCIQEQECPTTICGSDESYICGPACPPTCDQPIPDPACLMKPCVSGCYCNAGLVRASNNICIPQENCADDCGPSKIYRDCLSSFCPQTCSYKGQQCSGLCQPGCYCPDNYVIDLNTNTCIADTIC